MWGPFWVMKKPIFGSEKWAQKNTSRKYPTILLLAPQASLVPIQCLLFFPVHQPRLAAAGREGSCCGNDGLAVLQCPHMGLGRVVGNGKGGRWWGWTCHGVVGGTTSARQRDGRAAAGMSLRCWGGVVEVVLAGLR